MHILRVCILTTFIVSFAMPAFATFPTEWDKLGYIDLPAPSETLTDFPVVIAGMPAAMLSKLQSDFKDFRVSSDSDGSYPLFCDIPNRTSQATANAEIWVKIPSYSTTGNGYSGTNTRIFIWGNNQSASWPSETDATYGSQGVWGSSTVFASHMDNLTTSSIKDSSPNNYTTTKVAVNNPATSAAKLGYGQDFNGTTSYINIASIASTVKTYTISMWVKSSQADKTFSYLLDSYTGRLLAAFFCSTSGKIGYLSGETWVDTTVDAPNDGAWHYLSYVFNATTDTGTIYIDGNSVATGAYTDVDIGGTTHIGASWNPVGGFYSGSIDELQVKTIAATNAWVSASYSNQSAPSTYGAWTSTTYTITFAPEAFGDITGTLTQYILSGGSCSTVTAVPDSGFSTEWSGGYGTNNSLTITNVTSSQTITANFYKTSTITALSASGFEQLGYVDLPAPDSDLYNIPITLSSIPPGILDGLRFDFGDLRFTYDSNGTIPLPFGVPNASLNQKKDIINNEVIVKIMRYSATGNGYSGTNTRIFIWGNNPIATMPTATDTTWGSQEVWNDGHCVLAANMDDLTTSTIADLSGNGNTGTKEAANNPLIGTGKIGNGQVFNGSSSYVSFPANTIPSGAFTISAWVKTSNDFSSLPGIIFSDYYTNAVKFDSFSIGTDNKPQMKVSTNSSTNYFIVKGASTINDNAWHMITCTYDGSGTAAGCKMYIDGSAGTAVFESAGTVTTHNSGSTTLMGKLLTTYWFKGSLDCIYIADTAKSAEWIAAMYNDQNAIATYGVYATTYSPAHSQWYVGNSDETYGIGDGTGATNAWSGWDAVDWTVVKHGDSINDFSCEKFKIDGMAFSDTNPVTIDGGHSLINGAEVINSSNWTNLSGNVYYQVIQPSDIDYFNNTAPASPVEGEKWMLTDTTYKGTSMGPCSGRALEYHNGAWKPCNFDYSVNMAWKDGVKKASVITLASAGSQSGFDGYHISSASYGGHADNYWVGCKITIQTANYRWESSRITASTGNQVTFGKMSYTSLVASPTGGSYIAGPYDQMTTDGEWCFDPTTGRIYIYSTDNPSGHIWEASMGGCGILIRECSGITLKNYTIKNTNDSAIFAYKSPCITISNNSIDTVWSEGHLCDNGALTVYGESPLATWYSNSPTYGVNVSNNQISNTYSGNGIYLINQEEMICNSNAILKTGDPYRFSAVPCSIYTVMASGDISYNYISYSLYSGISAVHATNTTITHNLIQHSMNFFKDGGCLYLVDNIDNNPGLNTVEYNRIEYYGAQAGVYGLYFDNYSRYNTCRYNTVYNGPSGGAPENVIRINSHFGVDHITATYNTSYTYGGTMVGGEDYPADDVGSVVSNNVFVHPSYYPYLGGGVGNASKLLLMMQK